MHPVEVGSQARYDLGPLAVQAETTQIDGQSQVVNSLRGERLHEHEGAGGRADQSMAIKAGLGRTPVADTQRQSDFALARLRGQGSQRHGQGHHRPLLKPIALLIVGLARCGVAAAGHEYLIGLVVGCLIEKAKNPVDRTAAVHFVRTRQIGRID